MTKQSSVSSRPAHGVTGDDRECEISGQAMLVIARIGDYVIAICADGSPIKHPLYSWTGVRVHTDDDSRTIESLSK